MVKKHLKRINAPASWKILRKDEKFIIRSLPGAHSKYTGMALGMLLRDVLGYAKTRKEAEFVVNNRAVLVDGKRRLELKTPVGLFDTIELAEANKHYRILFDSKGKLFALPIEKAEAKLKPCKITGKAKVKGKTQLNLFDGKNILVGKDEYKVGDTLLLEVPKNTIKEHIKFGKGMTAYLLGGKHVGQLGKIEDIKEDKISYKSSSGDVIETMKEYAFVIGKEKPAISISQSKK